MIYNILRNILLVLFCCHNVSVWSQRNEQRSISTYINDSQEVARIIEHALSFKNSNPDSAYAIFTHTLQSSRILTYQQGILYSLTELAYLEIQKGNFTKAFLFLKEALPISPHGAYLAYIYNAYANVFTYKGDFSLSANYYAKAIDILNQFPHNNFISIFNVYYNLITVLLQHNQFEKVLEFSAKALTDTSNHSLEARIRILGLRGLALHYLNDDKGIYFIDSAIYLAKDGGLPFKSAYYNLLTQKAHVHLRIHQPQLALQALDSIIDFQIFIKGENEEYLKMYIMYSNAYVMLEQYDKAEAYLQKVEQKNITSLSPLLSLYEAYYKLYKRKNNLPAAIQYLEQFSHLKDSFYNIRSQQIVNELETKYRTSEKDMEIVANKLKLSEQEQKITRFNYGLVIGALVLILLIILVVWRQYNLKRRYELNELKAKIEGEEKERKRMARELHDGINSQLASIHARLYSLAKKYPNIEEEEVFQEIKQDMSKTTEDIRKIAKNLLPGVFSGAELKDIIQAFIKSIAVDNTPDIEFQAYGDFSKIDSVLALNIYRIIQELLHNAIKYAKAEEMILLLNIEDDHLVLTAEDNGVGLSAVQPSKGVGLSNIEERVKAHNGTISIESELNKGLTVAINIPLKNPRDNVS